MHLGECGSPWSCSLITWAYSRYGYCPWDCSGVFRCLECPLGDVGLWGLTYLPVLEMPFCGIRNAVQLGSVTVDIFVTSLFRCSWEAVSVLTTLFVALAVPFWHTLLGYVDARASTLSLLELAIQYFVPSCPWRNCPWCCCLRSVSLLHWWALLCLSPFLITIATSMISSLLNTLMRYVSKMDKLWQ